MYELVNFIKERKVNCTHFILTGDLPDLPLSLYPLHGSRVVLDEMANDPVPISPDTVGSIEEYDDECEIMMDWSNNRTLKLIPSMDKYHAILKIERK